jgi:transcription-repair coupling factor (superfamily II helicase)
VNSLLDSSPALQLFSEVIRKEPSLLIEQLWDAPKAALISLAAKATKKNVLIITGGVRENRLQGDFAYFGEKSILEFPSWETLPGEEIAPSPDLVGKRFETLHALLTQKTGHILLCPLQGALQRLLPPKTLQPLCKLWKRGDEVSFQALSEELTSLGYQRAPACAGKGEFALRGGILDIFPTSSPDPFRIDFFGDTIDDIRIYDPIGQKSIAKADSVFICPAAEQSLLRQEKTPSLLFDYLGPNTLVIFDDLLAIEDRYVSLQNMPGSKSSLFASFSEFFERIEHLQRLFWTEQRAEDLSSVHIDKKVGRDFYSGKTPLQPLSFEILDQKIATKRWMHPFQEINAYFPEAILPSISRMAKSALDLHFICSTESEENAFKARLKQEEILLPKKTHFDRGYLSSGFVLSDSQLALIPMTEFTHRYQTRRQKWRSTYHTPASDFHELLPGDLVVHFQHGIAKYLGTEKRANHLGHETEFLLLEYAESGKLYVPIAQSHLVSRYIGAHEEIPTLSTLGTNRWQRTRVQAEKAIIGYAQDLLKLNAERALHGGFSYPPDTAEMISFETDFPFVETEDQVQAIQAAKQDMTSDKAMDRLICGDVGYGKTEVAMRAAFKAAHDGKKQVAVLVPTTILALQHYETFVDRMANFPLNIGMVSRFCTAKEIKETLKKVANGTIDILIGTHRLISKDVHFKDLGLIIIDEEQRFGVRAKEHLKTLKVGVDCLTLSATPIPRTLYLSLIGARDISVINTPPQDRLPIKSIISERQPEIVRNALLRELSRDGQAFFIHNRVESIFQVSEELQKLLPEARVVTAHGQMSPDEIDQIFHTFKSGEADILVATTIVENGIDIPNANTILIDRADQFGLADLYQLRGRVGRWNRPAYAYFLTPQHRSLPELSRKRLFALIEASGYGGGMKIAMRDLEIRGSGDILGTQQSGQIAAIGFHLYCKLLKRTIDALRKKKAPSFFETKIECAYDASLPEIYIGESSLRMEIYHRLGEATTTDEVDAILAELKDRFGPPPPQVLWLHHLTRLRTFALHHQFTFLKFDTYTFTAEQKGVKKTLPLPRTKKPDEWETAVVTALKGNFKIT